MKENLSQIKEAVDVMNLDLAKTLLREYISTLNQSNLVALVLEYIHSYLPRFKEKNPGEQWMENAISILEKSVKNPNTGTLGKYPDWDKSLSDITSRGYKSVVLYAWIMVNAMLEKNPEKFYDYALDSLTFNIPLFNTEAVRENWYPPNIDYFQNSSEKPEETDYWKWLWHDLIRKLEHIEAQRRAS